MKNQIKGVVAAGLATLCAVFGAAAVANADEGTQASNAKVTTVTDNGASAKTTPIGCIIHPVYAWRHGKWVRVGTGC